MMSTRAWAASRGSSRIRKTSACADAAMSRASSAVRTPPVIAGGGPTRPRFDDVSRRLEDLADLLRQLVGVDRFPEIGVELLLGRGKRRRREGRQRDDLRLGQLTLRAELALQRV